MLHLYLFLFFQFCNRHFLEKIIFMKIILFILKGFLQPQIHALLIYYKGYEEWWSRFFPPPPPFFGGGGGGTKLP